MSPKSSSSHSKRVLKQKKRCTIEKMIGSKTSFCTKLIQAINDDIFIKNDDICTFIELIFICFLVVIVDDDKYNENVDNVDGCMNNCTVDVNDKILYFPFNYDFHFCFQERFN
ncbi:hypothetical protein QTP88_008785 [Uroleucon formosanum]